MELHCQPKSIPLAVSLAARATRDLDQQWCSIRETPLTRPFTVELRGFEPLTSSMPWKRATNCAKAPRGCVDRASTPPRRTREDYQARSASSRNRLSDGRRRTRPPASSRRRGGGAGRPRRSCRGCRSVRQCSKGSPSRRHMPARPASPCGRDDDRRVVRGGLGDLGEGLRRRAPPPPTPSRRSAERRTSSPRRSAAYASGSDAPISAPVQALPGPDVDLAQPRVELRRQAGRPRSARRRSAAYARGRSTTGRSGSSAARTGAAARGLRQACRVQRDVGLPLERGP